MAIVSISYVRVLPRCLNQCELEKMLFIWEDHQTFPEEILDLPYVRQQHCSGLLLICERRFVVHLSHQLCKECCDLPVSCFLMIISCISLIRHVALVVITGTITLVSIFKLSYFNSFENGAPKDFICGYLGPFSLSCSGVSSDYAQPITSQVTEVTCPVIGRAQPELTPSKRQKMGPDLQMSCGDLIAWYGTRIVAPEM